MKKILSLLLTSIIILGSSIQAAYLDNAFWAWWPTDAEIIDTLYGWTSSYTTNRSSNTCVPASMSVVYLNAPDDLQNTAISANTIYILDGWNHILSTAKNIQWDCIAIVWKYTQNIYSSKQLSRMMQIRRNSNFLIFDDIKIDWRFDGITTRLASNKNTNAIEFNPFMGPISNVTLNNSTLSNNDYWVSITSSTPPKTVTYTTFTNNTFSDSTVWLWMSAWWAWRIENNVLDNNIFQNNSVWLSINWDPNDNTITNNTFDTNWTWVEWNWTNNTLDSNTFNNNTIAGNTWTNAVDNNFLLWGLTEWDLCNNYGWCECTANSTNINDWDYCSDWNKTVLSNNQQCTDQDGCLCSGSPLALNSTCHIASSSNSSSSSSSTSHHSNSSSSSSNSNWWKDVCPNWDKSNSYYDGLCESSNNQWNTTTTKANTTTNSIDILNNNLYKNYNIVQKTKLLADNYKLLFQENKTKLNHWKLYIILLKYKDIKKITDNKFKIIILALKNIFSKMSTERLNKYKLDKKILLKELNWILNIE